MSPSRSPCRWWSSNLTNWPKLGHQKTFSQHERGALTWSRRGPGPESNTLPNISFYFIAGKFSSSSLGCNMVSCSLPTWPVNLQVKLNLWPLQWCRRSGLRLRPALLWCHNCSIIPCLRPATATAASVAKTLKAVATPLRTSFFGLNTRCRHKSVCELNRNLAVKYTY